MCRFTPRLSALTRDRPVNSIFYRLRKYFFKEFFLLAAVLAADGGAPEFGGGGPGDQDQIERVGDGIELNETFFR